MKLATDELIERIRRDDPSSWQTVEELLHHMPAWVQRSDAAGDIDPAFWSLVPVDVLNRMNMPVAYGGLPLTATALRRAVVFERVGRICPALPMGMPGPGLSMPPVVALGTETQKRDYFGRFTGRSQPVWGAFAITEPQGGSDATAMKTIARRDGNHYVLDGRSASSPAAAAPTWWWCSRRSIRPRAASGYAPSSSTRARRALPSIAAKT